MGFGRDECFRRMRGPILGKFDRQFGCNHRIIPDVARLLTGPQAEIVASGYVACER